MGLGVEGLDLDDKVLVQIKGYLIAKDYIPDFKAVTKDGKPYLFQYYSPKRHISVELYPEKKRDEIRISLEYDQLYFLVEYHIKLIHREFDNVDIRKAYAIGEFLSRGTEYARIHGGMETLSHTQALARIALFD